MLATGSDLDEMADAVEEGCDRTADGPRPDHPDTHCLSVRG
jgi:hypothetical protein